MVSDASMLETARPVVIAASLRVRVIAPVITVSFPLPGPRQAEGVRP